MIWLEVALGVLMVACIVLLILLYLENRKVKMLSLQSQLTESEERAERDKIDCNIQQAKAADMASQEKQKELTDDIDKLYLERKSAELIAGGMSAQDIADFFKGQEQ